MYHKRKFKYLDSFQKLFKINIDPSMGYSEETLLYRDILIYCLLNEDDKSSRYLKSDFGFYESGEKKENWMERNNRFYYETFHDPKSLHNRSISKISRTGIIAREVKEYLLDLEKLSILTTKYKPGDFIIEFKLTSFGEFISLMMELTKVPGKIIFHRKIIEKIYNLFEKGFEISNSSIGLFCKILYKKLNDADQFNLMIKNSYDVLQNPFVKNKIQFLQYSLSLPPQYQDKNPLLWKIYKESLQELKEKNLTKYNIFLFHLKQLLEEIQEIKCRAFYKFEQHRYDNREFDTFVTLQGYCTNCKYFTTGPADIISYFDNYFSIKPKKDICPQCKIEYLDMEMIVNSYDST